MSRHPTGLFRCVKTTTSSGGIDVPRIRLFAHKVVFATKTTPFKRQTSDSCPGNGAAQSEAEEMKHIVFHSTPS